jgi:hypothetical protein
MTLIALPRAATFAALAVASVTAAVAQTPSADPHHPDTTVAQATPPSAMTGPGTMGHGMMGRPGHMMKIMFAIADVNGDGALSFEEVTTIHKRIFDRVDVNRDGKVTPEEAQSFMRE